MPKPEKDATLTLDNASIGTIAPAVMGGHWCRTGQGWKWNGPDGSGSTFGRPGGDWTGHLYAPVGSPTPEEVKMPKPKVEKDAGFWGRTAARQGRRIRQLHAERKELVNALEEILKSDPCCCLDGDFHGDCQFCQARKVLMGQRKAAIEKATGQHTRKAQKLPPLVEVD